MIYCIYLFIYFCGSEDNCLDALTTPYLYIQYFFGLLSHPIFPASSPRYTNTHVTSITCPLYPTSFLIIPGVYISCGER